MTSINAIDELMARGYRVRHDGFLSGFWLISRPRRGGGYYRAESLTTRAVIALAQGRFTL